MLKLNDFFILKIYYVLINIRCNTDLGENDLEMTIVRGLQYNLPSGKYCFLLHVSILLSGQNYRLNASLSRVAFYYRRLI